MISWTRRLLKRSPVTGMNQREVFKAARQLGLWVSPLGSPRAKQEFGHHDPWAMGMNMGSSTLTMGTHTRERNQVGHRLHSFGCHR